MTRKITSILLVASVVVLWCAVGARAAQNTVTWTLGSSNYVTQQVFRAVGACPQTFPPTPIATLGPTVTTWVDTQVTEGTTYCYELNAVNTAGTSPFSNQAGRTVPFVAPSAQTGLSVGP